MSGDRVEASRLTLPRVPAEQRERPVAAWREPVLIDTYEPAPPCPYPMYLDDRVYQGSSGFGRQNCCSFGFDRSQPNAWTCTPSFSTW